MLGLTPMLRPPKELAPCSWRRQQVSCFSKDLGGAYVYLNCAVFEFVRLVGSLEAGGSALCLMCELQLGCFALPGKHRCANQVHAFKFKSSTAKEYMTGRVVMKRRQVFVVANITSEAFDVCSVSKRGILRIKQARTIKCSMEIHDCIGYRQCRDRRAIGKAWSQSQPASYWWCYSIACGSRAGRPSHSASFAQCKLSMQCCKNHTSVLCCSTQTLRWYASYCSQPRIFRSCLGRADSSFC